MPTIPVHFATDLEPDLATPSIDTATFDNAGVSLREIQAMRHMMEDATGAKVNFGWYVRMDRQVETLFGSGDAIAARYADLLETAALAGDEIGLHIHSIEQTRDGWRAHYGDPDVIDDIIEHSVEGYFKFFGKPCRSVRMGDIWTNTRCVQKLNEIGIEYDLTAESGMRPHSLSASYPNSNSTGWRPSMLHIKNSPYHPDPRAFNKVGDDDKLSMWMIPLTAHQRHDYLNPRFWALTALSAATSGFRHWRIGKVLRPQEDVSADALNAALVEIFDRHSPPSLCVAARNFGEAQRIQHFLKAICELAKDRDIQFVSPADYVRICQSNKNLENSHETNVNQARRIS